MLLCIQANKSSWTILFKSKHDLCADSKLMKCLIGNINLKQVSKDFQKVFFPTFAN